MNKKGLIAVVVLLLTLVAWIGGISGVKNSGSDYNKLIASGKHYEEEALYQKAITAYTSALTFEDSLSVRLKIIELYQKGIEIGEIRSNGNMVSLISETLSQYRNDAAIYDIACRYYLAAEDYEKLITTLRSAKKFGVQSETLSETTKNVRYLYKSQYASYDDVIQFTNGKYIVKKENAWYAMDATLNTVAQMGKFLSPYTPGGYTVAEFSGKVFLLDSAGVRQKNFDDRITASSGYADGNIACKIGKTYAYYNANAEKISEDYVFAGRYAYGVAAVQKEAGKWMLVDVEHNPLTNETYQDVILNTAQECASSGIVLVKKENVYQILTVAGYENDGDQVSLKETGSFSCDACELPIDPTSGSNSGPVLFAFEKDGLWGFADAQGKVAIEPKFKKAHSFSNGYAAVSEDGKTFGFADSTGNVVIHGEFSDAGYFNPAGVCLVRTSGDRWSVIQLYYWNV